MRPPALRLRRYPFSHARVSSALFGAGINMVHQAYKGSGRVGPDSRHDAVDVGRGRMKRVDGGVSSGGRGRGISLANQLAADSFARNVLPTIQRLTAAGFISQRALANELNRRRIPTARGGSWHYMTVRRVLLRLGLVAFGRTSRHAADARAEALKPTIRKLRKAGLSAKTIARELNARKIPAALGGKWHTTTVTRMLERLNRLDRASNTKHRPVESI
jgi:hypothetical protein